MTFTAPTAAEMQDKKYPVVDGNGPVTVPLTIVQRFETLSNVYKFQYFAIFRYIGERWGWDAANDIADEMAAEAIPYIAKGYQRKFGLPGEGAALVSQVLASEFQAEGSDFETKVESEDQAEYHVYCSFGNALQSGKFDNRIAPGLCDRGCWGWTQRVADTVKEGLHVERHAWMGDGAPSCHFTITPRDTVEAPPAGGAE